MASGVVVPTVVDDVFGMLVSGRPVTTSFTLFPDTEQPTYNIDIPNPAEVNKLTIFLLPGNEFRADQGVAVYASMPNTPDMDNYTLGQVGAGDNDGSYTLLGYLASTRPSPIFRTGWPAAPHMRGVDCVTLALVVVQIDTLQDVHAALSQAEWDKLAFAQLVAKDAYNYMHSFAATTQDGERLVLPTDVIDRWMSRFNDKFQKDPNFLIKAAGVASEH